MIKMHGIRLTKDLFLRSICFIYVAAFASIYHQIPGLYGENGILPLRFFTKFDEKGPSGLSEALKKSPSLVWLAPKFGLDSTSMLELISLLGITISSLGFLFRFVRIVPTFFLLYSLYFSIFQVGQTFLWFQWDILLLEVGFLTIFVSPMVCFGRLKERPHDRITMWLVRWLMFRFMFASGVVKLTSQCPTWWGLTALDYHFESQPLATPLAWYAHQLPQWLKKLGVVGTFVIEIPIPFLFFIPIRNLRKFSFYSQVLFQLTIILTGNYTFFNLLTLVLCLVLPKITSNDKTYDESNALIRFIGKILSFVISLLVYFTLAYQTIHLFDLKVNPDSTIGSTIKFTPKEFASFLTKATLFSIFIGAISLGSTILLAFYKSLTTGSIMKNMSSFCVTTIYTLIAIWLFCISLVPHAEVDRTTYKNLWPVIHKLHDDVMPYHLTNSYGLFRRMTGVGGRPEIIVEGSNLVDSGWKEYHFDHKPGDLRKSPSFNIPHQPRLDWQMWFAALSTYQDNPWLMTFLYRLLTGQPEVLDLIDTTRLPFEKPPKYIRVQMYNYHFTSDLVDGNWWNRKLKKQYIPPMDQQGLSKYMQNMGYDPSTLKIKPAKTSLKNALVTIRNLVQPISGPRFVNSIYLALFIISYLR